MNAIDRELERIRRQNEAGLLLPADVVEAAKPVSSPLHDRFEWDDTKAAHEHRLDQARALIRISVTYLGEEQIPMKRYYAVPENRRKGGGYAHLKDVLTDEQLIDDLLLQLKKVWLHFKSEYDQLKRIAGDQHPAVGSMEQSIASLDVTLRPQDQQPLG